MKLDFKKKHSHPSLNHPPSPTFSQFSPFRTVLSRSQSSKNLDDITNTGTRIPTRIPPIPNIQSNRFSLGDIDLIESEYSGRTNELEQKIEGYEREIEGLRREIGEKEEENRVLKRRNEELMGGVGVRSFRDDARLANSLVFEDQEKGEEEREEESYKEVRYGKRVHQFGEKNFQKLYESLIRLLSNELDLGIDNSNPNIMDCIRERIRRLVDEGREKQKELQELTTKFQFTKKEYYRYLVQILAGETEKQKETQLIKSRLQYSELINRQLDTQITCLQQQLTTKNTQIKNYKTQIEQSSNKILSLNLSTIQLRKTQSNRAIHLTTLLSMAKTSNCQSCRVSRYVHDIQQSLSLCQ